MQFKNLTFNHKSKYSKEFDDVFQIPYNPITGKSYHSQTNDHYILRFSKKELHSFVFNHSFISGSYTEGRPVFGIKDKNNNLWIGVELETETKYFDISKNDDKTSLIFEDCIQIINEEINKRRPKWMLTAIQWMDWDDIGQLLRIHISKKWQLWDQTRNLRPWLHSLITHQISNLIRNHYGNHVRPCLKCSAAEDENLCSIYTVQCSSCPLYAKWLKTKKSANDIKLPVSIEHHVNELSNMPNETIDFNKAVQNLHTKMKSVLKPAEYMVYEFLYINNGNENDVAKLLGFKTSEKNRMAGYRQVKNIKDSILKKAKDLIYKNEIDFN